MPPAQAAIVVFIDDPADALPVHGRQRGAGVEPVPTEPQDHATDGAPREVVGRHWSTTVTLEHSAETGSECDRTGEGDHAADGVHDGRAGEVTEERAARTEELEERSRCRSRASRPGPRPSGRRSGR